MDYANTYLNHLDVNRLHQVLDHPTYKRGEGRTMAYLHLMVTEVLIGTGSRYLYLSEVPYHHCKGMLREFRKILESPQYDLECEFRPGNRIWIERDNFADCMFEFHSLSLFSQNPHYLDGLLIDFLWLDLLPENRYNRQHAEAIDYALARIRPWKT